MQKIFPASRELWLWRSLRLPEKHYLEKAITLRRVQFVGVLVLGRLWSRLWIGRCAGALPAMAKPPSKHQSRRRSKKLLNNYGRQFGSKIFRFFALTLRLRGFDASTNKTWVLNLYYLTLDQVVLRRYTFE